MTLFVIARDGPSRLRVARFASLSSFRELRRNLRNELPSLPLRRKHECPRKRRLQDVTELERVAPHPLP